MVVYRRKTENDDGDDDDDDDDKLDLSPLPLTTNNHTNKTSYTRGVANRLAASTSCVKSSLPNGRVRGRTPYQAAGYRQSTCRAFSFIITHQSSPASTS
eukprot:SAG31_NODE_12_length_38498_cov_21.161671_16_plen_99_part_00